MCRRCGLGVMLLASALARCASAETPTVIAQDSKPRLPIVVSAAATKDVKASAAMLADYLGKITGGTFEITTGNGATGIAVGRQGDFPSIKTSWNLNDPKQREDYRLRSHAQGLQLVGASETAVRHAVWDLLHRVGYRQFFPGPHWEIIPHQPTLSIAVDAQERPSYHTRRIWYGFGPWDHAKEPYRDWCEKNRTASAISLNSGHAYDRFVSTLKKEFEAHPEYWPLVGGQRQPIRNPKPCLSNVELRAKIVRAALELIAKQPTEDSISFDPSDGGGWCECPDCAKLGSVTDQAITLANEAATALQQTHPGKLVGIYAYNYHSPPPTIAVHPQVVVSVATAFIKGGQSLDDILTGWSAKGATLGMREYYSVNTWDRDMPGAARGGNLDYLRRTIPEFHAKGARFMSAESSDNWGPNGLGYYLASRMLWDIKQADRVPELIDDFLTRSFGSAKEPMRQFYEQIDGSKPHLVIDDQLGRMFRALEQAYSLTSDPGVRSRLDDLTQYAHYCSLYHRYEKTAGADRQAAFEALIRFGYRMRTSMMIHSYALYRDLKNRDKTVTMPKEAEYSVPEKSNPWKSSVPFTADELATLRQAGIDRHPLVDLQFTPVTYSTDLVPAADRLGFPTVTMVGELGASRGKQSFYTHVAQGPTSLKLEVTGGLIAHYRDRGNVKIDLWKVGGASVTGEKETLVGSDRSVPPDGKTHDVQLTVKEAGLYKITLDDGRDRTQVRWPAEQPMTVYSSQDQPMNGDYRQWMQYFYVPKGTRVIGLFGGDHGEVRDSHDRPQFWLNGREPNFYTVAVPPGEDGKVWKLRYVNGSLRLLTVPPCLAPTPQALLLPREVVEKDAN